MPPDIRNRGAPACNAPENAVCKSPGAPGRTIRKNAKFLVGRGVAEVRLRDQHRPVGGDIFVVGMPDPKSAPCDINVAKKRVASGINTELSYHCIGQCHDSDQGNRLLKTLEGWKPSPRICELYN